MPSPQFLYFPYHSVKFFQWLGVRAANVFDGIITIFDQWLECHVVCITDIFWHTFYRRFFTFAGRLIYDKWELLLFDWSPGFPYCLQELLELQDLLKGWILVILVILDHITISFVTWSYLDVKFSRRVTWCRFWVLHWRIIDLSTLVVDWKPLLTLLQVVTLRDDDILCLFILLTFRNLM